MKSNWDEKELEEMNRELSEQTENVYKRSIANNLYKQAKMLMKEPKKPTRASSPAPVNSGKAKVTLGNTVVGEVNDWSITGRAPSVSESPTVSISPSVRASKSNSVSPSVSPSVTASPPAAQQPLKPKIISDLEDAAAILNLSEKSKRAIIRSLMEASSALYKETDGRIGVGMSKEAFEKTEKPTHAAARGTVWISQENVSYVNVDGGTSWQKVGIVNSIKVDSEEEVRNRGGVGISPSRLVIGDQKNSLVFDGGSLSIKGTILSKKIKADRFAETEGETESKSKKPEPETPIVPKKLKRSLDF